MPAPAISKADISDNLLRAKQSAVNQFLVVTTAVPRLAAFAASTRPQDNVVGVSIGYKVTKGKPTAKRCIRFYVYRKIVNESNSQGFRAPAHIDGVPTDVIETGRFLALPAAVPRQRRRLRPAQPGCSVGFQFTGDQAGFVMAGTFGAVAVANGTRYILSNNHVLANENSLPVGSRIFQPGLFRPWRSEPRPDRAAHAVCPPCGRSAKYSRLCHFRGAGSQNGPCHLSSEGGTAPEP